MCVSLSGIRRFSYIVVRESGKGKKAQIPNTWRYIDFLTGRLQAAGFVDTAPAVLRNILYHYNKVSSIDECQTLLLQVAKARKSVSVKPNEHSGTCIKSAMAGKRVMESDEADSMEIARQAVYIEQMSVAGGGHWKILFPTCRSVRFSLPLPACTYPKAETLYCSSTVILPN